METRNVHRWINLRHVIVLGLVICGIYLYNSSIAANLPAERYSQLSNDAISRQPSTYYTIDELEAGNFTLWALHKFKSDDSLTTKEMYKTRRLKETQEHTDVMEGEQIGVLEGEQIEQVKVNIASGVFISSEQQITEGEETADSRSGSMDRAQTYSSTQSERTKEIWNRNTMVVLEEKLDKNPVYEPEKNVRDEYISGLDITKLLPRAGNTLPNYLLHGIAQGLSPEYYRDGILVFLHHNKAAGSSIKSCLSKMLHRELFQNHSLLVFSSKMISKLRMREIMAYNAFAGGYTFWLCELYHGQNCSYFTIMRDPYDRIISSYYYCQIQHWDQLCGPLRVGNFTIEQWAIYQGSYFFNQLLMQTRYCKKNDIIQDIFQNKGIDFVPIGTTKYIDYKDTFQCWFKQKVYLDNVLNETGKLYLLENVLDNLESWFSVIGMTEDFDLSLKMLSVTYDLPFYRRCRGKHVNPSPSNTTTTDNTTGTYKSILQANADVTRALFYDLKIYKKGNDIFQRQKQRLHQLQEYKT